MAEHADIIEDIQAALDPSSSYYQQKLGLMLPVTLASVFSLNEDTLKQWRIADKGPNYVRIGKRVWYLFDDVAKWIQEEKTVTTQKREYPKDNDKPTPTKHSTAVDHPTANPPVTPADADDAEFVEIPPEENGDYVDGEAEAEEDDQFDRKVPDSE